RSSWPQTYGTSNRGVRFGYYLDEGQEPEESDARGRRGSGFRRGGNREYSIGSDSTLRPEILGVFLLHLLVGAFLREGIGLEQLDRGERRAAGLLLHFGMEGAQAADIAHHLLAAAREEKGDEEPRRVGVRCRLHERGAADDERRPFGGIDD